MNPDPTQEQTVTVDGRPVCCRVLSATAPPPGIDPLSLPVLLLHGLGCSADVWGPALAVLDRRGLGQQVYAPDLPGYGDSADPPEALGMPELADWAAGLLDRLGIARAHLAGNSMGCQVALELARRHPERVAGVVLIGPTTGARHVSYWRFTAGLFLDCLWEPWRLNMAVIPMYVQMGPRRFFATVGRMRENEPLDYAGEIAASCLVLRGEHDGIVPDAVARELTAKLPHSQFRRVSDAAHAVQFSQPDQFVDLAVTFWRDVESPPSAASRLSLPATGRDASHGE